MEDVARACGVTKKTVSRVFAGNAAVKASTREKILDAAQRLHYEFNTLAQNFSAKRSRFLGVAMAFDQMLGSSYIAELFRGFSRALSDTGMDFALFDTNADSFNDGEKLAKLYRQRRVDGLLVVAPHSQERFLDTLAHLLIPMVVVGVQPPFESVRSVSCDDQRGIRLLCSHLHGLGHRRIAFVGGPSYVTTADRRKQAYVDFSRAHKLDNRPGLIFPGDYSLRSGMEAGLALLKMRPRPMAIIAANDVMAYGVMESARQLNLRIPQDVSVAGFDDLPTAAERYLPLTTIHQPVAEIGERSARILLESLDSGVVEAGKTVVDVSLKIRESTAAPRSR